MERRKITCVNCVEQARIFKDVEANSPFDDTINRPFKAILLQGNEVRQETVQQARKNIDIIASNSSASYKNYAKLIRGLKQIVEGS